VYQHPVPATTQIEARTVDLEYAFCDSCGHAFLTASHRELLEDLYTNHYYTPAPRAISQLLRGRFLDFVASALNTKAPVRVVEIGCSSGDQLLDLQKVYPEAYLLGIEPDRRNADAARSNGLPVVEAFFTLPVARNLAAKFDLIFARHVIEHVFDFEDVFQAIDQIANEGAVLVLETPALEAHLEAGSIDPYHIEHTHVFSSASLVKLAAKFGWFAYKFMVTPEKNSIMAFQKGGERSIAIQPPLPLGMNRIEQRIGHWRQAFAAAKQHGDVLVWGAGSFGRSLLAVTDMCPVAIIDGNPNKAGLKFVGLEVQILFADDEITRRIADGTAAGTTVIVASTYHAEIVDRLRSFGWNGRTIDLSEL
jgi:SAM-dependent methyltransferase